MTYSAASKYLANALMEVIWNDQFESAEEPKDQRDELDVVWQFPVLEALHNH